MWSFIGHNFKEGCWATFADLQQHFGHITCFISNKSVVHKWFTVFALKIFKDNHNITKVEGNIFLFKSTQQTKWYLAEAVTTQTCFAKKHSEILGIILRNTSVEESFFSFRPAVLLKKRLMNGQFPVSSCKHIWTAASDLGSTWQLWPSY